MIKNKLITTLLCLLLTGIADAQEKAPQVIKTEPQLEDIYNVLTAMNIHIYRFDVKEFLDRVYTVNAYVDEYEKDKSPKRIHNIRLGKNIKSLDEIPEKHRQAFREIKHVPEGKNEWEEIKELAVYLRRTNDSTSVCTINIPEVIMAGASRLHLKPIEKYNSYVYYPRPFKFQPIIETNHFKIPLILYGSAWLDEKYDIIRFCGEREIDQEMNAEILEKLPHYYIIGLEFKSDENN